MTTSALLVGCCNVAVASGERSNCFGSFTIAGGNEANVRFYSTAAVELIGLRANITGGGSGTNTLRCRTNAGADGNQVATRSGAGFLEDANASNFDIYSAGSGWTLACTDTGTTPTYAYMAETAIFSGGHYGLHAIMSASTIFDVANATRFISFSGALETDGASTDVRTQWKNRAYSSWESLFVRIATNARLSDSIFRNRINGANGTLSCTYGTGVTGLLFDDNTGAGDAVADGDLLSYSVQLSDAGVQDLVITAVGCCLLSTTNKADCIAMLSAGATRTGSATAGYHPPGGGIGTLNATEANVGVKAGFVGRASNLRIYSSNTYASDGTIKLYINGSPAISLTLTAGAAVGWTENTSDTATFTATDTLSFEFDEGGSGTLTMNSFGITLEDTSVVTSTGIGPLIGGYRNVLSGGGMVLS